MHPRYARSSQFILLLGDLLLLNGAFLIAAWLRFQEIQLENTVYYDYYLQLLVFVNLLWLVLSLAFKTYNTGLSLEPRKSVGKTFNIFFWHLFVLLLLLVSLKKGEYSRLFLTYFYLFSLGAILPWHFFYLRLLKALRKRRGANRHVVYVGLANRLEALKAALQKRPELGISIDRVFLTDRSGEAEDWRQALPVYLEKENVQELYAGMPSGDGDLQKLFYLADERMVRFRAVPDLGLRHSKALNITFFDDVPVMSLRPEPLEQLHLRLLKRVGDLVVSTLLILTVVPWLFPLLALGVKSSSPGPVFFRQKRTGYHNRNFTILKFRSMRINAEADLKQADHDDARITSFGRFLRTHHLDELPQIFNVWKGDMSLVGPRPHMLSHTEEYRQLIRQYMVRHWLKPGMTGLAQVKGLKGAHDLKGMQERVKHDVYYLEHWTFFLDLGILLKTFYLVFKGK